MKPTFFVTPSEFRAWLWYRRNGVRWIMEGKAEETRLRRLQQLIETSADERRR